PEHAGGPEVHARRRLADAVVERVGWPESVGIEAFERILDDLADRQARGVRVPNLRRKRDVAARIEQFQGPASAFQPVYSGASSAMSRLNGRASPMSAASSSCA